MRGIDKNQMFAKDMSIDEEAILYKQGGTGEIVEEGGRSSAHASNKTDSVSGYKEVDDQRSSSGGQLNISRDS